MREQPADKSVPERAPRGPWPWLWADESVHTMRVLDDEDPAPMMVAKAHVKPRGWD